MKRIIYTLIGLVSFGLGVLGTALPVLPTTPFLLLSAFCFAKGSPRLENWLKNTSLYKKYLEEYLSRRALTFKQKISIQITAGLMLMFSFIMLDKWIWRIVIILLFITYNYIFIFRIKTYLEPNEDDALSEKNEMPQSSSDAKTTNKIK